jgi:hypothetical protein
MSTDIKAARLDRVKKSNRGNGSFTYNMKKFLRKRTNPVISSLLPDMRNGYLYYRNKKAKPESFAYY